MRKLSALAVATKGDIPYFHTRRWNGSGIAQFRDELQIASSNKPTQSWMIAAVDRARRCRTVLSRPDLKELSTGDKALCDFTEFSSPAKQLCSSESPATAACLWAVIVQEAKELPALLKMEVALGVLQDQAQASPGPCPPLASPTQVNRAAR